MRSIKKSRVSKWMLYFSLPLSLFLFTYQVIAIEDINLESKEISTAQMISDEEITNLTNQFMVKLVQEVDENYKVINFDTKESLKASFDHIANRDVINEYIDFYYEETKEGLFILPTELPPWFIEKNDYDMIQLKGNQVKVIQENDTDLYAQYTITFEFTFDGKDHWKITNISLTE